MHCPWVYRQVVIPRVVYGSIVWWHKGQSIVNSKRLDSLQRQAIIMATGAMRATPTLAMEALPNIPPLQEVIKGGAMNSCLNMHHNTQHRRIKTLLNEHLQEKTSDGCEHRWN
jgi:hypothetical protein